MRTYPGPDTFGLGLDGTSQVKTYWEKQQRLLNMFFVIEHVKFEVPFLECLLLGSSAQDPRGEPALAG